MTIITVGIDLAKNVFAVHGVDDNGKAVLVKPKVARDKLAELISELGIILPQQAACLRREIGAHLEDLPGYANRCIGDPLAHADGLDLRIDEYDRIIAKAARDDARSKRLMKRPGIGPIGASALLASIGGGHDFKNNRQVAAWMGLTPVQLYARYHLANRLTERYLVPIWINDSTVFHTVVANRKRVDDFGASRNDLAVILLQARNHDVHLGGNHGGRLWCQLKHQLDFVSTDRRDRRWVTPLPTEPKAQD
jgi:hypothetical protein